MDDFIFTPLIHTIFALFVACVSTAALIILLYPFAQKIDLVDHPNKRKLHSQKIPLIGGIAMFVGVMFGLLLMPLDLNELKYYVLASSLILIVGVFDDYHPLSHWLRLLCQVLAALMLIKMSGISLISLGGIFAQDDAVLNSWSLPLTVLATVGVINSLNFIDGVDGMAGSMSLVPLVSIIILSFNAANTTLLNLAWLLVVVLIPFLLANLNTTKKIFMGDAGSMFLGFGVAAILIGLSQGDQRLFAPVTALWIFAIPLIDLVSIMIRRVLRKQSPFLPDREHIHHIFIRAGYSDKQALVAITCLSIVMAVIGVASELYEVAEWKMFAAFLLFSLVYGYTVLNSSRFIRIIYNRKINIF